VQKALLRIAGSSPAQFLVNIVLYALYAFVLGLSLAPSAGILAWSFSYLPSAFGPSLSGNAAWITLLGLCMGVSYFVYLMWGSIVQALAIRLLSLGIKPGVYPMVSGTCLRWIIYSGIFTLAVRTILPVTVMSFFCKVFFRIVGAKIGKNVYINTPNLNDAQFLTLDDDVVVGGASDVSCHTFEGDKLILGRISIGSGSVIGAHAYIFPGVTIGKRCSIGVETVIRKNRIIPDGSVVGIPSGMPMRSVARIERENR
jgi:acetyltransferase-like isoleucine patch superfamily enzyme